jgi:hypothetical protein
LSAASFGWYREPHQDAQVFYAKSDRPCPFCGAERIAKQLVTSTPRADSRLKSAFSERIAAGFEAEVRRTVFERLRRAEESDCTCQADDGSGA